MKHLKLLSILFLFLVNGVFAEKAIPEQIRKFSDKEFISLPLLIPSSSEYPEVKNEVTDYKLFNIDHNVVKQIIKTNPDFIRLSIGNTKLILYRVNILTDDFKIQTSENEFFDGIPIVNYRGIIENDYNSLASITISEKEVCGFYSDATSNKIIGKLQTRDVHIVYDDRSLISREHFSCQTIPNNNVKKPLNSVASTTSKCVRFYLEVDNDIYVGRGSDLTNVTNFIEGAFAQVATLYANDGISIKISQIYVWTTPDPFVGPGMGDYLFYFASYRSTFNGDLSHLIGYDGGGGIAFLNGLCSSVDNKAGYSVVSTNYAVVPDLSWTVLVLSHEMGHQIASPHTHDCVWNGNNTAIDGCGPAAGYTSGSCPVGPIPSNGGTIMSYCHLLSNVSINFNNGFGPQPAALMNNTIAIKTCLTTCDTTNPPPPPPPPPGCTSAPSTPGDITGPKNVCKYQQNVQYSIAPVPTATSYTWTVPGGSKIVVNGVVSTGTNFNTTSTTIGVNFGNKKGNISVKALNSCGTSKGKNLGIRFVCREELAINDNLIIYPNPSSTTLTINFEPLTSDYYLISIYNNLGQIVYQNNIFYDQGLVSDDINVQNLSEGSYIIQIKNQSQLITKQFRKINYSE